MQPKRYRTTVGTRGVGFGYLGSAMPEDATPAGQADAAAHDTVDRRRPWPDRR
jgi:hypothetical protein